MQILIIILLVIAAVLVIILIAAALQGATYTVERTIMINLPKEKVFNYLKLLRNQDHFSKWVMMDPNMKKEFRGTDGTVGFVYAWDSKNQQAGKGEQEIVKLEEGERIDMEVRFIRPFANTAYAYFAIIQLSENVTKVIWGLTGTKNYMAKVMHLVLNLKKVLGRDIETSLGTLKNILEKQKK